MNDSASTQAAAYQFAHLTTLPPETVRQIGAIYDVSFPREERKPFSMVSDAMSRNRYDEFVVSQGSPAASQVVAFALLVKLRTSGAMYIEYLAVAPQLRGRGIGSLLVRSTFTFLSSTPSVAVVWEVDPPDQDGDDKTRRIRFYERLGAHMIEQSKHYAMPNYYAGSGLYPLRIMWKSLHHDQDQPTKAELVAFITDIYETEYPGQAATRDQIIARLDE